MSVVLSIFLSPNILMVKKPTSLQEVIKNLNLSGSCIVFLSISMYAWIFAEMHYAEIMFRTAVTLLQYILVYYISTGLLAGTPRKNITIAYLIVIFITAISNNAGGNYRFVNIIGSFFYLPVQLFIKGKLFIAFILITTQLIFLAIAKRFAHMKVEELHKKQDINLI